MSNIMLYFSVNHVQGLSCLVFVCLAFVVSSVCLSKVIYRTALLSSDRQIDNGGEEDIQTYVQILKKIFQTLLSRCTSLSWYIPENYLTWNASKQHENNFQFLLKEKNICLRKNYEQLTKSNFQGVFRGSKSSAMFQVRWFNGTTQNT